MDITSDKIIEQYSSLAKSIANKYSQYGVPFEDLLQEGLLGILEAAKKYDESKGTKFSTYATYWIKKKVIEALEKERKSSLKSLKLIEETVEEKRSAISNVIPKKIKLPPNFPELEKKIILSLYEDQKTLQEIAQELGISRERTRQLKEKALRRLRAFGDYKPK